MSNFTLHELQCFDAVVAGGSFQAAADRLHRSHPSVFAAVAKLEEQLGLSLLDRSGYRVQLTDAGQSFHRKVQSLLRESEELRTHARQLAMGEEAELRVVLGDLCPLQPVLALLSQFFGQCPQTRLQLQFEAVTGPWERLLEDEADLIVHRVPKGDVRMEWIDLGKIAMVPVVATGPYGRSRRRATTKSWIMPGKCLPAIDSRRPSRNSASIMKRGRCPHAIPCTISSFFIS